MKSGDVGGSNSDAWQELRSRARTFKQSRFVRNVVAVATGVAAAQVISLAFMPLLTRLYGPEAFGALAAFTSMVNIVTPLATMGFANAIVMPETEEGATAVARLSLVCAAVVAPMTLICVLLFQSQLATWTGLEETPGFLYLVPASLLLVAVLSVANQMAIREGLFRAKARSQVSSTFLMNIGKLGGGLLAPYGAALIVLSIIGTALNWLMLLALVPRKGAFRVRRWFGTAGIRAASKQHRDFALFRMPQSMLNAMAVGLPVILLTAFSGAGSAGQYSLTTLVLGAPVALLGASVSEVFYPKITDTIRRRSSDAWGQTVKATLVLAGLALIPMGVVILVGPILFELVLGGEWTRAGEYARWVALWQGLSLATRPVVAAFPALRLQSYLLFQEILSVVLRSAALIVGLKYFDSDIIAVALYSMVGVALMGVLVIVGFAKLSREIRIRDSE